MLSERNLDGVGMIANERCRQRAVEGWTDEHDDQHTDGSLAQAAACYALPIRADYIVADGVQYTAWPWGETWDKREKHNRLRQLAIAGALIAAEIDRLKRLVPSAIEEKKPERTTKERVQKAVYDVLRQKMEVSQERNLLEQALVSAVIDALYDADLERQTT